MDNFGGGFASGYIIGSMVEEDEERARQRRLAAIGRDQVLLKVKAAKDAVGEKIASIFGGWIYKEGCIKRTDEPINLLAFILGAVCIPVGLVLIKIIFDVESLTWLNGGLITIILSTFIGRITRSTDIDFIKLSTEDDYTVVLIKKYDADGYRNMDDDDIMHIIDALEDMYRGEKEVHKSLYRHSMIK